MSLPALHAFEPHSGRPAMAARDVAGVVPASRLSVRPQPLTISTGIAELDELTGGLPRGALTEVVGPASSGRSSVLAATLSAATARAEICALVDAADAFNPQSAAVAGVDLRRVLWVRCGPRSPARASRWEKSGEREAGNGKLASGVQQALKAADLLLQAGGFGLVVIDLADAPPHIARRIPLTSWFRFRRAVENTPTVLLVLEQQPFAKTCASLVLKLANQHSAIGHSAGEQLRFAAWHSTSGSSSPPHANLLAGLRLEAEVVCNRTERKPVRSVSAAFQSKAAWAG